MKIEISTISFVLSIISIIFIVYTYLFNMGVRNFIVSSKIVLIQNEEKPMTIVSIINIVIGAILGYLYPYNLIFSVLKLRLSLCTFILNQFEIYLLPCILSFCMYNFFYKSIKKIRIQLMHTSNNYYPSDIVGQKILTSLNFICLIIGFFIGRMIFDFLKYVTVFNIDNIKNYYFYIICFIEMFFCIMPAVGYLYTYAVTKMFKKYEFMTKESKKYLGYLIGADKEHYFIKQKNSCALLLKQSEIREVKCIVEESRKKILEGKARDINYLIDNYFINNNIEKAELKEIFKYLRNEKFYIGHYSILLYLECWRFFHYKIDEHIPNLKIRKQRIFKQYYFER